MTISRFYNRYLKTEKTVDEIKARVDSIDAIITEMLSDDAPVSRNKLSPRALRWMNETGNNNTDEEGSDNCREREDVVYAEEDPSPWFDVAEESDNELTQEELEAMMREVAELDALQRQVCEEEAEEDYLATCGNSICARGWYEAGWADGYDDAMYDYAPEEEPVEI